MLEEKVGLEELCDKLRQKLVRLRVENIRVERIRRKRNKRWKEGINFFRYPFKHAQKLLDEKRSGRCNIVISKDELEKYKSEVSSNNQATPFKFHVQLH